MTSFLPILSTTVPAAKEDTRLVEALIVIWVEVALRERPSFSLAYIIKSGQIMDAPAELINSPTHISQNRDGYSVRALRKWTRICLCSQAIHLSKGEKRPGPRPTERVNLREPKKRGDLLSPLGYQINVVNGDDRRHGGLHYGYHRSDSQRADRHRFCVNHVPGLLPQTILPKQLGGSGESCPWDRCRSP
jgi:hypothetical protein